MKINLNDTVRVRLTEHGRAVLRKHIAGLGYESAVYDEKTIDTKTTWQLWELAQIFGPSMYNGAHPLFKSSELEVVPSAIAKQIEDALTVEARILVRVDVDADGAHIAAAAYPGAAEEDLHERVGMDAEDNWTENPRLSWVTARVPKPSVSEVEGTVET